MRWTSPRCSSASATILFPVCHPAVESFQSEIIFCFPQSYKLLHADLLFRKHFIEETFNSLCPDKKESMVI